MEGLVQFFMLFAGIVCLFAVVTVLYDFYKEKKEKKESRNANLTATPAEVPSEQATPAEVTNEEGVWISRSSDTHAEKYAALGDEVRRYYDIIKAYALNREDIVSRVGVRAEDFRIGKRLVVRMAIRRGAVYCEFLLANRDLNNRLTEAKVNVKQAATSVRIDSEDAVIAAKSSIDLVISEIEEDKKLKSEQQKARRRETRARRAGNNFNQHVG